MMDHFGDAFVRGLQLEFEQHKEAREGLGKTAAALLPLSLEDLEQVGWAVDTGLIRSPSDLEKVAADISQGGREPLGKQAQFFSGDLPEYGEANRPARRRPRSGASAARQVLKGLKPAPPSNAGMLAELRRRRRAAHPPRQPKTTRALSAYMRTGEGVPMPGPLKRYMKGSRTGVLFQGTKPPPPAPQVARKARKRFPSMLEYVAQGTHKKLAPAQKKTDEALLGFKRPIPPKKPVSLAKAGALDVLAACKGMGGYKPTVRSQSPPGPKKVTKAMGIRKKSAAEEKMAAAAAWGREMGLRDFRRVQALTDPDAAIQDLMKEASVSGLQKLAAAHQEKLILEQVGQMGKEASGSIPSALKAALLSASPAAVGAGAGALTAGDEKRIEGMAMGALLGAAGGGAGLRAAAQKSVSKGGLHAAHLGGGAVGGTVAGLIQRARGQKKEGAAKTKPKPKTKDKKPKKAPAKRSMPRTEAPLWGKPEEAKPPALGQANFWPAEGWDRKLKPAEAKTAGAPKSVKSLARLLHRMAARKAGIKTPKLRF